MKSILGVFFLIVSSNPLVGQSIHISDASGNASIQYANIIYYSNGQIVGGTYSNKSGNANLSFGQETDSIEISCIGYYSKKMPTADLPHKIYLEQNNLLLREATISLNFETPIHYIGFKKRRKAQSFRAFKGLQMVTLISNPYKSSKQIKSFVFLIRKLKTDNDAKLKIIFFENNKGRPGEQVPAEIIVKKRSIRKHKTEINLDTLNIFLPKEGLFAGIEWMGCVDGSEKDEPEDCKLAIMVNSHYNEEILNQTFDRRIFYSKMWMDVNKAMKVDLSMIPVFGLNVYD